MSAPDRVKTDLTTVRPVARTVAIPASTGSTAAAAASRPRRKRHRFRKAVPWVLGFALLAAIVSGLRPKPLPVEVGAVHRGAMATSVLEEGKTRIRHRYTISPPVGGLLERVELRAGDRIEAGKTVLATIRAEPASLLNPRLQSEAEARVRASEAVSSQREADLERARTSSNLADRERKRAEPLHRSGAISAKEWDTADLEAAMRARELRSAEFALQVAKFELQQSRAALLQAQGHDTGATSEPFRIVAPVSGYVLNVFEESSRVVAAGTQVMEVGDTTDLEAEIELLSTDAAGVRPGAEAIIERWGGPKPLRATVSVVEPAAFTKVSALGVEEQRVRVRVNFADGLPSEQFLGDRYRVEARIVTWSAADVLQAPTGALFRRGGEWMCFLVQQGRARMQKVEIGHNNGITAEVLSGLNEGEQVILHPPDAITPDSAVQPRAS